MFNRLEKVLMPIADKLGSNKILIAIRDGFLITTPLIMVASIFLLIANFPVPGWEEFLTSVLGNNWASWFTNVSKSVFNTIALLSCIGTGYAYCRELGGDSIQGGVIAVVSFWILTPTKMSFGEESANGLFFDFMGSNGLFLALVIAIASVALFEWISRKGWVIKMPAGVPPAVVKSFAALIPSAIVMTLFFLIRIGFELTPFETAQSFIYTMLQTPLQGAGNTLFAQIIYSLACTVFWFFGINGPAVANSVFGPITKILTIENLEAFQQGLPYTNIFTDPFSNFFTSFGGGGSTLSLVIVMLLFCKSKRIKQLGKLSGIPGLFGINEPIIFGLPIVLNPIIIIPFILVPIMNLVLSTLATEMGIIPITTGVSLPWTMPIFFSGWLSTGNVFAGIWQLFLLFLGCLVYYPFIKILDKKYLEEELVAIDHSDGVEEDEIDFDNLDFDEL